MAMVSGLHLKMDGTIDPVVLDNKTSNFLASLIDKGCFLEVVRINDEIDMFVDEEGKYKHEINVLATHVYRHFMRLAKIDTMDTIHGNAVFLGSVNKQGYSKNISAKNYKKIEEVINGFKDLCINRFDGFSETENMNNWFAKNTAAENLYDTKGELSGTINMVVHSKDLAEDCRKLLYKFKESIIKYAVTYSRMPWINVEIECVNSRIESQILDEWQQIVEKCLPDEDDNEEDD